MRIVMKKDYVPSSVEYKSFPIYQKGICYECGVSITERLAQELISNGVAVEVGIKKTKATKSDDQICGNAAGLQR